MAKRKKTKPKARRRPAYSPPAPKLAPHWTERIPPWTHWVVGLGLPILVILWRVKGTGMLAGSDVVLNFYYVRSMVARCLLNGSLPVWDPHTLSGFPHLAAIQGAVFYPLNWLFIPFTPGYAWTLTAISHYCLAYVFAYLWLRRGHGHDLLPAMFGGLIFSLSGYLIMHTYAGHIAMISAYPWTAAIMWLLEMLLKEPRRRYWVGLAVVFAVQILAGYPELCFFSVLLLVARGIHYLVKTNEQDWRLRVHRLGFAATACLIGVLLSAPQLLPTLQLVRHTTRSAGAGLEFATSFSLPPENIFSFLAPTFLGDMVNSPYWGRWFCWEGCAFLGLTALLLCVIAVHSQRRQKWLWAGVLLAGVVLALGRYTPFFPLCYKYLPGFAFFRAPGRYLFLYTMAAAWLAAAGLEYCLAALAEGKTDLLKRYGYGCLAVCGMLLVILLLAYDAQEGRSIFWRHLVALALSLGDRMGSVRVDNAFLKATYTGAWRAVLFAVLSSGLLGGWLLLTVKNKAMPRFFAPALIGWVAIELLLFGGRYLRPVDEATQKWPKELVAELRKDAGRYRVTSVGDSRDIGRCQFYGIDHVGGNDPMLLRRYAEAVNVWEHREPDEALVVPEPTAAGPLRQLLGVKYCVVQKGYRVPPRYRPRKRFAGFTLCEAPKVLPRIFFVPAAKVVEKRAERLKILAAPYFDPAKLVLLEKPVKGLRHTDKQAFAPEIEITRSLPGQYEATVNLPADGFLVLAENYYPGWQATVDGHKTEVLCADHFVQAIRIDQGKHHVRFAYKSTPLRWGLAVAIISLILLGTAWYPLVSRWLAAKLGSTKFCR